jgi:Zn-finger protein
LDVCDLACSTLRQRQTLRYPCHLVVSLRCAWLVSLTICCRWHRRVRAVSEPGEDVTGCAKCHTVLLRRVS